MKGTGAALVTGVVGGAFLRSAAPADRGARDIEIASNELRNPPEGLVSARALLRQRQAEHPTPVGLAQSQPREAALSSTLTYLNRRRNFEPTGVPGRVTRDGLLFDRNIEERRIALAEDLVRRTDPGPFEDPNYFALLAYQAASIELALPDAIDGRKIEWGWEKFLLGTIHAPQVNAYSETFSSADNYTIVVLFSALVEFAYQAAKAVIAALHPVQSTAPGTSVMTEANDQHIADELSHNKEPIERLYRTLEEYYFITGYPRRFYNESPPAQQVIPLTLLIDMAERWIIAHEYGHGVAAQLGFAERAAPAAVNKDWAEEYFADQHGMILTALSAKRLDHVGPGFSLAGPVFALACLEVLRRSLSVVRHGTVLPDSGGGDHPPNQMRIKNILNAFDFFFDVDDEGSAQLALRGPDWTPVDSESRRALHATVMLWPNVLYTIWDHVRPLLENDYSNKRTLLRMWT